MGVLIYGAGSDPYTSGSVIVGFGIWGIKLGCGYWGADKKGTYGDVTGDTGSSSVTEYPSGAGSSATVTTNTVYGDDGYYKFNELTPELDVGASFGVGGVRSNRCSAQR